MFFLINRFVPAIEKKNGGAKKETSIIVERKKINSNVTLRYQIVDSIAKFTPKEWYI